MLNIVALMGRLTHTPELKTTQNGTSVCSFSIAVDRTYTRRARSARPISSISLPGGRRQSISASTSRRAA